MQRTVYDWLGHEWVALRAEGSPQLEVPDQTREVFSRLDEELRGLELSLDNTVRTRLWARDRSSRDQGSRVRVETLTGAARSASSSFIAPDAFDSHGAVAVELWAMRPATRGTPKTLAEYDPPIVPLRYLVWESVVVLSGVTSMLPTLASQVPEITEAITRSLTLAGIDWEQAVKISCILHRSQSQAELRSLLGHVTARSPAVLEISVADGYSTEGKLVEVEVTAQLPR